LASFSLLYENAIKVEAAATSGKAAPPFRSVTQWVQGREAGAWKMRDWEAAAIGIIAPPDLSPFPCARVKHLTVPYES
jgi:uncharacterized protein YbjT (DUF2867 family)